MGPLLRVKQAFGKIKLLPISENNRPYIKKWIKLNHIRNILNFNRLLLLGGRSSLHVEILRSETLTTQYKLMVLDMYIRNNKTWNKVITVRKIRWLKFEKKNYKLFKLMFRIGKFNYDYKRRYYCCWPKHLGP